MRVIYLDHNATTRLDPRARAEMAPFLDENFGNPSSIHAAGRAARDAVERARDRVAGLVRARADEIVFTSSGTEGDNLAVRGAAEAARAADPRRTRVVTSRLEHPAVIGAVEALAARGFAIDWLPVSVEGRLDEASLAARVTEDTALVTLQLANHELGNLHPIARFAEIAHARGAWLHTDAVQAAGKIPVDVGALGVDLLTISAHKLHGPKGVGAVWVRDGRVLPPHTQGGHQERERRPGTENVAGIVGFGAACRLPDAELATRASRVARLRDRFEAGLVLLGAQVNGDRAARVPNTTHVAWPGIDGELVVASLDLVGVAASTGAACTSGSVEPSQVVLSLGQSHQQAKGAVRFSLGPTSEADEIDEVLALLPEILARLRSHLRA